MTAFIAMRPYPRNQLSVTLLLATGGLLAGPESCDGVLHELLLRVGLHRAVGVLGVVDLQGKAWRQRQIDEQIWKERQREREIPAIDLG